MGDKPGGAEKLDLTLLFFLFLLFIIIGLGTAQLPEPRKDGGRQGSIEQGQMPIIQGGGCEQGVGSGCSGMQTEPIIILDKIDTIHEFTILVECYEVKQDAYWEAGRLRASQVNNFIMEHQGAWYVCVGKYYNRKRAERQVAMLKKYGVPDPVVFPPGKSKCVPPKVIKEPINGPCDWCIFVIITIVLLGFAVIAQCCKPKLSTPSKKCEVTTTTTTTTVTKTEIKDP